MENTPTGTNASGVATSDAPMADKVDHDPRYVRMCQAEAEFDIPKSSLSKAAKKAPGEVGHLPSVRVDRKVYFKREDLLRVRRSRGKLRR